MYRLTIIIGLYCFILLFNLVIGKRSCNPSESTKDCLDTEECDIETNTCQCKSGFERINETVCIEIKTHSQSTTPNSSSLIDKDDGKGGSIAAGILIPLFLLIIVICVVYISKRHNRITHWIRMKINQRNNNYDEFMIGQDMDDDDDPPLR